MSLLSLLRKFVDPVEHRREEEERRRQHEDIGVTRATADEPPPPPPEAGGVCRICGHEGPGKFCPTCLAETMVEKK